MMEPRQTWVEKDEEHRRVQAERARISEEASSRRLEQAEQLLNDAVAGRTSEYATSRALVAIGALLLDWRRTEQERRTHGNRN